MRFSLPVLMPATPARLRARRDALLRRLVAHAYEQVPHYRRLFDRAGLRPDEIHGVDDLSRIPITSRRDIQGLPVEEVVASGYDPARLLVHTTSGSSGAFLDIRHAWGDVLALSAFRWRALLEHGLTPRDRVLAVGLVRDHDPRESLRITRVLAALGLFRTTKLDCRLAPERIAAAIADVRPHVLIGTPGAMARACASLDAADRARMRTRLVVTGGEVLAPLMRRQLTTALPGARVYDAYSSHEFGLLAWECGTTGEYHTCDDAHVIEVLRDGRAVGPGEHGELVATNLYARAMPFLRYRLADAVVRGSEACPCGAPYGTIREIRGRMIDYFTLPDGQMLHPYRLSLNIPDRWPWIRRYQYVQERRDLVRMRVEPYGPPSGEALADLRAVSSEILGAGVEFCVEIVETVGDEPNGKFRVARSLVASPYDDPAPAG
jgi:phenylacetate-CoA ligase